MVLSFLRVFICHLAEGDTKPNSQMTEEWIRAERQLLNVIVINLFYLISESTLLCLPLCYWNWTQFSRVQLSVAPWTAACQASLYFTNSRSLLRLVSIESVMPSNHLILCHPILLRPSIFPGIRVFSNELVLHITWPKYWSFSFSISPSNEYSGLISFRTDWFDLLEFQGTPKSLLQHHSSKVSVFWDWVLYDPTNSHIHTWLLEKP